MQMISAAQMPDIHGDIEASLAKIIEHAVAAEKENAILICYPECFLQRYVVHKDLTRELAIDLSSPSFKNILGQFSYINPVLVIGLIEIDKQRLFNTAVVIKNGQVLGKYRKTNLTTGEHKVFTAGDEFPVFEVDGIKFGINICYDLNFPECAANIAAQDAQLLVCPCNNMLRRDNAETWKFKHNEIRSRRTVETGLWLLSSDVTGTRDNRISYGPTAVIDPTGSVVSQLPLGQEGILFYPALS